TEGGSFGSISHRHLNSWLAFTSCRRATSDTDEPASSVSAAICRFSSSGQSRRLAGRDCLVSTKPLVDTSFAVAAMRPIMAPTNDQRQARLTERLHELLDGEIFYSLREAEIVIESWRRHYNTIRPHASIGYRAPAPEVFVPALAAWPAARPRPAPSAVLPLVPRPTPN